MGSSGVRWHPSSAMPHEYARPEIPWEKDSGPQFPKFNRTDAGCGNLTGFQPIQQTSQTIFWNPLLLQSPKWETHLSEYTLAHPGSIAFQEQHKASTWCQTISKLSWKVFPPQPVNSQVWNMSHTGKQVGKTMGPKRQVWSTMDSWYRLAESQKLPGLPSIGAWRGGTYTYPKWPRMQNICKIHVKHTHLRLWNVCDAYVKRMCSASENICEPYVKHMWKHMRNTFTEFGTGLRCVYVLLMYTFANLCVF